jgi:hypothetical protein
LTVTPRAAQVNARQSAGSRYRGRQRTRSAARWAAAQAQGALCPARRAKLSHGDQSWLNHRMAADTGDMSDNRGVTPDPPPRDQTFQQFMRSIRRMSEKPVTAAMIAELPDSELDDRVWLRLCRVNTDSQDDVEALHPLVRAYLVTRLFDWEVGNGGVRQYFLNFENRRWFLPLVLDGYTTLGLDDQRRVIEERIVPVAYTAKERRIRSRDRVDFFGPRRKKSQLDELNDLIGEHDDVRVALIRANPELFAG